jgi:CheY-like chemotaxis protein
MSKSRKITGGDKVMLLLVEDNPADVLLAQEALGESIDRHHLLVASDGQEALNILQSQGRPLPDLILLDLNLPRKNGWDVLTIIKQDELLKHIPVVIMTSSQVPEDIHRAYRLHANAYVTKTLNFDEFYNSIQNIANFWLETAKLPSEAK